MTETVFWCISEARRNPPGLESPPPDTVLHPAELVRYQQMKFPKRREEWFHGRTSAKRLLTTPGLLLNGTPLKNIHIDNFPEGAPYIAAPLVPCSLSISHRETLAAITYTQSQDLHLGIDLEKIEPRAWSFIEDFFTTTEADFALSLTETEKDLWVTLAWSAKEAILKAWQKGLRLDTRKVEIVPLQTESLSIHPKNWQSLKWKSHLADFPDCWLYWQKQEEFVITLAVEVKKGDSKIEPPNIQKIEL